MFDKYKGFEKQKFKSLANVKFAKDEKTGKEFFYSHSASPKYTRSPSRADTFTKAVEQHKPLDHLKIRTCRFFSNDNDKFPNDLTAEPSIKCSKL